MLNGGHVGDKIMNNKVELKFKKLCPDVELPQYAKPLDSGMDIKAYLDSKKDVALYVGKITLIPTKLSVEIPHSHELQVRPRSGMAIKKGITVINSPGTIDEGYRGEIKVGLVNLGREPVYIKHGDRIAQLVLAPITRANIVEANELSETNRGDGGFGSTGDK